MSSSELFEFGKEISEGNLTATIDDVADLDDGDEIDSGPTPTIIQTLPWKMSVSRDQDILSVKLSCNDDSASTLWNCAASIKVTATLTNSHGEIVKKTEETKDGTFDFSKNHVTVILKPDTWQGSEEKLKIDARIVLTRVFGVRKRKLIDYSVKQPLLFNGILSIEGKHVHVNKQLLTMHSAYFENLFFGKFRESAEEIVDVPDVKYKEFCEFLDIIHPTRTEVVESTVESLLELADRFGTEEVTARCEKFLLTTKEVPMAKKLILAQQFRLGELMDRCLKSFNSLEDMFRLKKSVFFSEFNDDVKSSLLERLIKLADDGK